MPAVRHFFDPLSLCAVWYDLAGWGQILRAMRQNRRLNTEPRRPHGYPHEQILALTLIPAAATIFGGAIAVWRTPSETVRSVIQHFAAGVVLAAVAGELLPEMTREHQPLGVVIGFILGVALMLCVKLVAERVEARDEATSGGKVGLLAAVAIDIFIDGLLIGVGFAAGAELERCL